MSKKRKFRESEWIFRLFRQRFEGLLYRILAALRIYELVTYSNPQELKRPSVSDKETEGLCNAFRGTTLVDRSLCPLSLSVPRGDEYGLIGNGEETRSNLRSGWTFSLTARGPVDQRLHTALHRPAAL